MGVFCVNTKSKEFKATSKRLNIHPSSLEVCVHLFLNSDYANELVASGEEVPFPSDEYIRSYFLLGNKEEGKEAIDAWVAEYGATDGRVTESRLKTAVLEYPSEAIKSYLDSNGNKITVVSRPNIKTVNDLKYLLQKLNIIDKNNNLLGVSMETLYERLDNLAIPTELSSQIEMDVIKRETIANGTFMKAPNGRPTNLNEKQWLQVRTRAFKNWFGDWEKQASKATISNLVNSNGEINWDYYESLLDTYHNSQPDSVFAKGRYTLATRPENHFTGEKNTLNHIKFVTQSMLDLFEGKYDMDLPFVSEARASLQNLKDLMVIAAMFHDVAKPYRHGDIHGWESADILRDILGVDYNNRVAEWAVRHHMPMPFSHKANFSLLNPEAMEVAKNIARDARRIGIDAQTAINAFVLINAADIINGRDITVSDNWAKKAQEQGENRYGEDISVKNVLSIELEEKVDLLKRAFKEIEDEEFGDTEYNYRNQERFDYIAFPEGGRDDKQLPYLKNTESEVSKVVDENGEPLVVYRIDDSKFDTFDRSYIGTKLPSFFGKGFYFTPSFAYANSFPGSVIREFFLKATKEYNTTNPEDFSELEQSNNSVNWVREEGKEQELVVFDPNQIKSASDNVGTFSNTNNNIYFQKQPITVQTRKLWTIDRTLENIGSDDNIRSLLNSKGIDSHIIDIIIDAINKEPELKKHKPLTVFNIVRRAEEHGMAKEYNEYLQKPINSELEKLLLDYLKPLHVTAIEDEVAEKYGVTGVYDILNKIIHLSKNRNAITVTEEFAHAFIELMGARVSGRPENEDFTFLYNTIETTSIYKQVYEQYKDTYTTKDEEGNTVPDIRKIKKEAIGQALAVAINNKWEEEHTEEEKSFWEKLKAWFNSILDFFSDTDARFNKFLGLVDEEGYIEIQDLLDKIATEVLHNDYTRLQKIDAKKYNLLDFTETIEQQTKKDGGKALDFMQWYSSIGNIITGSLAYRKQGTVYRPAMESLHDIDMVVPLSVHGVDLNNPVLKAALEQRGTQSETMQILLDSPYFKKVLEQYPDLEITAAYSDAKGGIIVNSLWSENKDLKKKFEDLSGTYADRLEHFTQEERDQMYLFDFFLESTDDAESFIEEKTGITLSAYPRIFKSKLALGRAKDIFDYQMWDLYEEFKSERMSDEEYLMFQKPIQYNPEQQRAIKLAGDFIADRQAKEDFFLISGKAGTGKTTIINEIVNRETERLGRTPNVFITAIANKAVLNLDAKIEAMHTKKATASALGFFESTKENGEKTWRKPRNWNLEKLPISSAELLFIDECSMLDTAKLDMILQVKKQLPNLKIVMIGDRGQIHSIEDKDSSNDLLTDNDINEGFAPSVVFTYKNKREATLLTRVRQGEDSPILEFADNFWQAAVEGKKDMPSESKATTVITKNGAVIRYKDSSSTVNEDIAENLLPLFQKAKEDSNPDYVKIVAVHREQVQRYNDLIYGLMYPDEDNVYQPLHAGDMIMFYAPYGQDEDELGNPVSKYYNSSESVVQRVLTPPYKANLSKIIETLHRLAPKVDTAPFENIMVQDVEVTYNGKPESITIICPSKENTEALQTLAIKLGVLANEFYRSGKTDIGALFITLRKELEEKIADVRLNYAISAHKSQGSTYQIVVVDSKDIRGGRLKSPKYAKKRGDTWGGFSGPGERSAIMYTAITRASNVTVVLHGTAGEAEASYDINTINDAIVQNKQGKEVAVPQAKTIKPVQKKPATIVEEVEKNDWKDTQEKWDTIFDEHNDHIEFVDTVDKHEYWYYPNGKDDTENKQKMDTTVTTLTNPVANRNMWLTVSGNIGTSADRVVRDFFMGVDVLDRKYPNFTKEQLKTLVENLKNFKEFLDKEYGWNEGQTGVRYKIVTSPFSLVGKVKKYNGSEQTVGGTVDILVYDEDGGYMIFDIKTTRKDDLRGTDTLQHYISQLNLYRELLEAMHPELKGRCNGLGILQLHTFYATPEGLYTSKSGTGTTVYTVDENTKQIQADGINIENHKGYEAPHFVDDNVQKAVISVKSDTPNQYYLNGNPRPLNVEALSAKKSTKPIGTRTDKSNKDKATTRKVNGRDVTFSANMFEEYEDNKRDEVSSGTTLDAIVNGERTATTRWSHIEGFYDQIKKGDIVEFHDKKGRSILVKVTKAPTKLDKNTNAEEWSNKEGWSVEHYKNTILPHVKAGEAYQMEYEYVEGSYIGESTPERSEIDGITISQQKDKHNYTKGYPQKHKDTAFIFTENALANAANLGLTPVGPERSRVTLNVNAARYGKFNQADIRTDEDGERTENAFGLIVKKYQQEATGNGFVEQAGCFTNSESDFELFKSLNLAMFKRLEESGYKKMVFPFEIALGKAALPKRFAEWLSDQLEKRYGIVTELARNTTKGYNGWGLKVKEVNKSLKASSKTPINIHFSAGDNTDLSNFADRTISTYSLDPRRDGLSSVVSGNFKCVEAAFQAQKLGYTNQYGNAEYQELLKQLENADGYKARQIGRKIRGLDEARWNADSSKIMKVILKASFQQDTTALTALLDTGDAPLTHLSKAQQKMSEEELNKAKDDDKWIEEFPKLLMEVRDELRESDEPLFDDDGNPITSKSDFDSHFTKSVGYYAKRTDENAEWSDVTLQIATDLNSPEEKRTAKAAGDKLQSVELPKVEDGVLSLRDKDQPITTGFNAGQRLASVQKLNEQFPNGINLNIAGNGMYTLEASNATQDQINAYVEGFLRGMIQAGVKIKEVRSGGQTGVDEAGIIAALKIGLNYSVHAPIKWTFRVSEETFNSTYKNVVSEGSYSKNSDGTYDIMSEALFKERFKANDKSQEEYDKAENERVDALLASKSQPITETIDPNKEFTEYELELMKETRNLVELSGDKDTLFKPLELKSWAKACMFLISDMVSVLNSTTAQNEDYFQYIRSEKLRQELIETDFTKMSRIEILTKLGNNVFSIIQQKYFNAANNPNGANLKRKTLKKLAAINDNFNAFVEMGRATLTRIENVADLGNTKRVVIEEQEDIVDGETAETLAEIHGSSIEAWQVNFRGVSAHNSLSLMVKRVLETCYDLDENGNQKINEIGIPERINSSQAVNNILMWTQGSENLAQMVEILKDKQPEHPWLSQIITKLDESSNDETFKAQFWSNFKKYFQPYIVQYVKETKDITGRVVSSQLMNKVINQNSLEKQLLEEYRAAWQNRDQDKMNLFNLDGTMDSSSVDIITNAVEELKKFIDSVDEEEENIEIPNEIMHLISDIYWVFDIELDGQLMNKLNDFDKVKSIYKNLTYLGKNLSRNQEKADYDIVKNNEKNLQKLFSLVVDSTQTTLESVAYEDGKLHYSYVTPSYLTKLIDKLKGNTEDYEAFIQKEYGQFPWFKNENGWRNEWLRLLNEDENVKNELQHAVVLTSTGVGYRDKSPMLYAKSMLLNYFYGGKNSLYAFYRVPMMSNKPSEEYIRFRRYITDNYQDEISRLLMNVAYQEIDRIQTCRQRANTDGVAYIKSFDKKNGEKFMFLDYLQTYLDEYLKWKEEHPNAQVDSTNGALLLGKMLEDRINGTDTLDNSQFEELLQYYIKENMSERFQDYWKFLKAEGVLVQDEEGNYIHLQDLSMDNSRSVQENLENFFWNDTFAAINILQLTITDVAFYKDAEDLQKRLAQIHAPGLRANLDAKWNGVRVVDNAKKTRTIYINDFAGVVSDAIENIRQVFEAKAAEMEKVNPKQAEQFRELAKHILEAFKDINVTDAQGYSSITSYRKKAIIFGKWSDELETMYNNIRNGNYNTRDLQAMLQPLKPFVYSNTTKESVGRLNKLKVGMQNKNSEYLLLMMDAILQGEESRNHPTKSKLAAIYKVMEDSHYDEQGNYKPDGIDTVQFNSTVKAGEMGVIDINGANTTQETILILENAIYAGGDRSNGYNMDSVHELEFEDYCIQNEVPAHLEGQSIFGSQMRILSIADMPEIVNGEEQFITFRGVKTSLRQLKQDYMKACADNILNSLDELRKQFNLTGTRAQKNIALSRILQEQIQNDSRFGFDLKYAVMTDEQGNFNIPISDPIQAGRIQQLLNSVIKTRINKQQIEGGPVVQVTNFGTSEDLNIIFKDAEGNLLQTLKEFYNEDDREYSYKEFLNMAHYENSKKPEEKALYDNYYKPVIDEYQKEVASKQAGIAYFECYAPSTVFQDFADENGFIDLNSIPLEMREIIGFRIPTEAKYSMVPLRIVGLLPSEAGEGIMLPKDITTLSGSDFDIDKLYIIRPVVELDIEKVRKEYRRLQGKTYDTKAIWDDIYANFPELDALIKQIQKDTYELYKQNVNMPDLSFEDFLKIAKTKYGKKRKLDWIPNSKEVFEHVIKQWDDINDYVIDNGILMSFKEFREQAKKQAKYYTKVQDMNTKKGRDNFIFDTIYSILTSEQAMDQIFVPGNFDVPKKYGYMAEVLKLHPEMSYEEVDKMDTDALKKIVSQSKNLVYNNVHLQFHKQNMVAGKLIGIFAQNNVSHGFISLIDQTAMRDSQGRPIRDENGKFKLWRPTINLPENLIIINNKIIGGETSYDTLEDKEGNRISSSLAAFLAASVDAVKDPVLNYMNVNEVTAGILTSLLRMGYNTELAMLLLTLPVIREFVARFNIANEGNNYKSFNSLINEMIDKIIDENEDASISSDIVPEISKKGLIQSSKNRTAESDVNLLKAIQALNQVSEVNSAIISLTKFNSVTSAVGPMLSNTILMKKRIDDNRAREELQTVSMLKALDNPIIRTFREASFAASDEIFEGLMLQGSAQFRNLIWKLDGMIRGRLTDKEVNKLADFYMAFMLTKGNPLFKTADTPDVHSTKRRKEILQKLPNKVKKAKKDTTNKFLKRLEIRPANDSHSNRWLYLNIRGMSGDISDEIGAAWQELYLDNPELAMELIEYNFYVGGLGFNPNTFSNLIPVAIRKIMPNYVQLLNPQTATLNSIEQDRLLDQFFRNNYWNRKLVPDISKVKGVQVGEDFIRVISDADEINMGEEKIKYVVHKGKLYKISNEVHKWTRYDKVSELGGKNSEILEVNALKDVTSIFDEDFYSPTEKEDKKEKKEKKGQSSDKMKVKVEGTKSKVPTIKPTSAFISQIQYFILNQVNESERKDRINRLWRSLKVDSPYAAMNALKSLFNDTLGKGVYNKEVFGLMDDISHIMAAALKGLADRELDIKSLEKKINAIRDTENDLNICG